MAAFLFRGLRVIGVMSGTSVDGIDVSLVHISPSPSLSSSSSSPSSTSFPPFLCKLKCHRTYPWSSDLRSLIFSLFRSSSTSSTSSTSSNDPASAVVCRANFALGEAFGDAVLQFMKDFEIAANDVDLIGSHGQTVWHDVTRETQQTSRVTSTLQIGEAAVIAFKTGITTVDDFRVADVAAGGQGAPLVSIFDLFCLSPPPPLPATQTIAQTQSESKSESKSKPKSVWRALQNIGGIGNVTLVPSWSQHAADLLLFPTKTTASSSSSSSTINTPVSRPVAFDTGPGNALIDRAAHRASGSKLEMDVDGLLAASGKCHAELLRRMMEHPYFAQLPPKTTGRELFGAQFADEWYDIGLNEYKLKEEDIVATFTDLTALSIVQSLRDFAPLEAKHAVTEIVVGGGGACNPHLMSRIQFYADQLLTVECDADCGDNRDSVVDKVRVVRMSDIEAIGGVSVTSEAKESVAFALLAYLCVHGSAGNVPWCTGASVPRILGKISPSDNFSRLFCLKPAE